MEALAAAALPVVVTIVSAVAAAIIITSFIATVVLATVRPRALATAAMAVATVFRKRIVRRHPRRVLPRRFAGLGVAHHHQIGQAMLNLDGGAGAAAKWGTGHPQTCPDDLVIQTIGTKTAGDNLWCRDVGK